MFYYDEFSRKNKKILNNDIIKNIIEIFKPKNIYELAFNFTDAGFIEIAHEYKDIQYKIHTLNPNINKIFDAKNYLSDNFSDNSIINIAGIPDPVICNHLLSEIIPAILKKHKNILVIMIFNFIDSTNYIVQLIDSLSYIKYKKDIDPFWLDISSGVKYKLSNRYNKCFLASTADFSESKFNKICDMIDNYE
jgi:hypothetical protein